MKPMVIKELESFPIEVEYLENRSNANLEVCNNNFFDSSLFIACIIGKVRLIDNIQI
jgi:pantothenate synthetase